MSEMAECPACGEAGLMQPISLEGSRTHRRSPLFWCWACRSFFQRPGYREDDSALEADLQWHLAKKDAYSASAHKVVGRMLAERPGARTLLDIGCGIGTAVGEALKLGLRARGVEPNPYAHAYATRESGCEVALGFFRAADFAERFDLVLLDNVLEHVPRPREFIAEVISVLADDGLLYLAVPGNHGGVVRAACSLLWPHSRFSIFVDNDVHINHFYDRGIRAMTKAAGGSIVSRLGPGVYLVGRDPAAHAARTIPSRTASQ